MAAACCTTETVYTILTSKVGVPVSTPQSEASSWEELEVDSLGITETVLSLEQELHVTIPDGDALRTRTVGELIDLVNTLCV